MNPLINARIRRNGGFITRTECYDLGLDTTWIRSFLYKGEWVVLRRGVYADAAEWASLDPWHDQPMLMLRASLATMRRRSLASHDSAAIAQKIAVIDPRSSLVHVTRAGVPKAWTANGIRHHLARFTPEQVRTVEGIEMLDPARTAVDIARDSGFEAGVVACDSAMRLGATRNDLVLAYEIMRCWPGVTQARAAVDFADPSAENAGESLHRLLVHELGLPEPIDPQFPVQTPRGIRWADLRVGRHFFEFDGLGKYLPLEVGGLAETPTREVLRAERDRQADMCAGGFGMSRSDWRDVRGARREQALARLRREYFVTRDRFGTEVPPQMLELAARVRAQHRRTA